MNLFSILQVADQVLLLAASVTFAILSLSFVPDIVMSYRKKSRLDVLAYTVLFFGVGRVALEGLLTSWDYWRSWF